MELSQADYPNENAGFMQRCVIIQRDQQGFGFTVCGDRRVLVQHVRPGGAAMKAGVHEGDRIIKVNGLLVSSMTHQEMVRVIKAGTYVALTLQDPQDSSFSTSIAPILDLQQVGSNGAIPSLHLSPPTPTTFADVPQVSVHRPRQENLSSRSSESSDGQQTAESGHLSVDLQCVENQVLRTSIIGPEENEDEEDANLEGGPFQDVERLKSHPAHMIVFMRYIFSQLLNPNPLLFFLSADAYLSASVKDTHSLAQQIYASFLGNDAPLKIPLSEELGSDIESRVEAQEDIIGALSEIQKQILPSINRQIQDYRSKQMIGLGHLFGEGDLQELEDDPAKEKQIIDRQVAALWDILCKHEDRSSPMTSAVILYLRHYGVKVKDSRLLMMLNQSHEKEKWSSFFPKPKKVSTAKKEREKEGSEDKKKKLILKYIPKPKIPSQSNLNVEMLQRKNTQEYGQWIRKKANDADRDDENNQKLVDYQQKLDLSQLERVSHPAVAQLKKLDLTTKKMIHEGPLLWRVRKDKIIELQALLLEDQLILLQRVDDRFVLRFRTKYVEGGRSDLKTVFSPVINLDSILVRLVATDARALFVISTSESQIYELVAGTLSEKNLWKNLLEEAAHQASNKPCASSVGSTDLDLKPESSETEVDVSLKGAIFSGLSTELLSSCLCEKGIADSALLEVEKLRQLILWSADNSKSSDIQQVSVTEDTNETVSDSFQMSQSTCAKDRTSHNTTNTLQDPHSTEREQSIKAVRKGNFFYLVMVPCPEETSRDGADLSNSPKHECQENEKLSFSKENNEDYAEFNNLHKQLIQPETKPENHVIHSIEKIFQAIENLTLKLEKLKNIELAHFQLLKNLSAFSVSAHHQSQEMSSLMPLGVVTQSCQRGAGDGKEDNAEENEQMKT
ncbi:rho guanine nucleotide exchange factor 11 isoform X2 [Erpetoichthys calabaricus]|nr:rho guanine nucleotide exchange factor 11 isoform X2 [Erpetoichthys calabaricus]XP_051775875.1 rho guanine nucleotide exchange factor 11 isoform X2 [Erpetoichthys calabaricus]XP_051775876.1 rho guanine nucleotide exchange factor 11 isoform X2 [Erpetoichthys calabaricus]